MTLCCGNRDLEYFHGFSVLQSYRENDFRTNVIGLLTVISYFTLVIPLLVLVGRGIASLRGRVCVGGGADSEKVQRVFSQSIAPVAKTFPSIEEIHTYLGPIQGELTASFENAQYLKVSLVGCPELDVSIRAQDLFEAGAEVIVNAANTHLGGGGGIDGMIHRFGGVDYQNAHQELKTYYKSQYTEGYAAWICSGALQEQYKVHHVIVVAGPQGSSSPDKDNALYSCYYNSLMLAHQQGAVSIAFPSISTGIYRFPKEKAASISLRAIYDFCSQYPETTLKKISIHFLPKNGEDSLKIYQECINDSNLVES